MINIFGEEEFKPIVDKIIVFLVFGLTNLDSALTLLPINF